MSTHPYQQHCDANCGCCTPITDQAESDDSALLIPEEADCGDNDL